MSLSALIAPKSVALVGANEKKGFGGNAARNLIANRESTRFYFVNPKYDTVLGEPCYASLADLPETVDCVELAIPKYGVNEQLELAGSLGIKAAVVFASGYTEEHSEEGRELDAELVAICKKYDMNLLGPNCMGLINVGDGVNLMGLGKAKIERDPLVAVISHSGALTGGIVSRGNYPVGYQVSVGNGSVTTMEDFMDYFIDDERTKVIALYMEGIKKPQKLLNCFRKAAIARKPIVVYKSGRSEIAARSAASHTGSLTGSFASFEATCRKYGVVLVETFDELILTSNMLAVLHDHMPKGTKVAGFNLSGGGNVLMAEAAFQSDVEFAAFDEKTLARLQEFIPQFSTASNPLDATTDLFFKPDNIKGIVQAMSDCEDVDYIIAAQDMGAEDNPNMRVFVSGLAAARKEKPNCKPVIMNCITEKDRNEEFRGILYDAGIPLMGSVAPSMQAMAEMNKYISYRPEDHSMEIPEAMYVKGETVALTESESKKELVSYGVRVPGEVLVEERMELDKLNDLHYPMVAKVSSPDILHKSDVGAVKLDISDAEQAAEAFEEILMNCRNHCPDARIEGVVFQEMAPKGQEFIIGVNNDPQLGPMIMVGMGGVFVEVFKDVALQPAPVSKKEAEAMLNSLKSSRLLHGYRGTKPLDVAALSEMISQVSRYAFEHSSDLKELDINPVIVYPEGEGVIAVDALVVKNK